MQASASEATVSSTPQTASSSPQRIMAIDALRGFDMFWILGGEAIVEALDRMGGNPLTAKLAEQFTHKEWAGFAFYDLIFPLFVFVVGVSLVFSLSKSLREEGPAATQHKIGRRFIILFALALIYSGGFSRVWPDIRLLGVLNRIALCYLFAALVFCRFQARWKA